MILKISCPVCYEGDADADAAAAAAAKAKADAEAAEKVSTQDQLNAVLAREKRKFQAERDAWAKKLEDASQAKGLGDEEKAAFEAQIEELRSASLTVEEKARRQKEKDDKEWQTKFATKESEAKSWQDRHNSLYIGHEINAAAREFKVLPESVEFVTAKLGPNTRLVENIDPETNKGDGSYKAMVKIMSTGKDGKPIPLDLTVSEAVKLMKETPDKYGFLFEGNAAGGIGAGTGQAGGKGKSNGIPTTVEGYLEAAKKNPALLGRT